MISSADDSSLRCRFKNSSSEFVSETMNSELINVSNWINTSKLKLYESKAKLICFSYRKTVFLPPIDFQSQHISEANSIKFLGILIDKHPTFKELVN